MTRDKITYQQAGVDADKADEIIATFGRFLKGRPKDPALLSGIGPYASCYSLKQVLGGYEDPLLVTSCDGVGTKVKLALDWNRIDGLGQDLVAMNVNDTLCVGARPILFLDYYACGALKEAQLLPLLKSIQAACEACGCSLAGGETAEMPGIYSGEDFDLAGFAIALVDRRHVLGAEKVRAGDRLLALPSSGLHSTGFSLVRRIVERDRIAPGDKSPFGGRTWKDVLLEPTTLYVKLLEPVLTTIHAAAHITGSGLFGNLPRVLPDGTEARVESAKWPMPPLFAWLQERAGLSTEEMLSTFNCGVGMILAVAPGDVAAVTESLGRQNVKAWEIGRVEAGAAGPAQVVWR